MADNNPIIENIDNPQELERMYRKDPEGFKKAFSEAWEQNPNSPVLAVWHERLYFKKAVNAKRDLSPRKDILLTTLLAVLAGVSTRIILYFAAEGSIAPINLVFGIFTFMAIFLISNNAPKKSLIYVLSVLFVVSVVYINLLPLEENDNIILAYLHLPVFLWVILGLTFMGDEYLTGNAGLAYIRFSGEFGIVYAILAICGIILTILTTQLFVLLGSDGFTISNIYFENVIPVGAAAFTIVTAYLVLKKIKLSQNIAPLVAKIFSPIVLAVLIVYLAAVVWTGKNPFLDRAFLLMFNGILLIVLAVTIFSISESREGEKKSISDYINLAIIILALIIDSVALSAIVFRLSSYGITPNRLAVLGLNLLIWANLIWIMVSYIRFLMNKTGVSSVQNAVTKYIPIYGVWAAFVVFAFPVVFG